MNRWWIPVALALMLFAHRPALGASTTWPATGRSPGPGGFASIVVESPAHGSRVQGPDLEIRLRTDHPLTIVRVRLDGKYLDLNGRSYTPRPGRPHEGPQLSFRDSPGNVLQVPVRGLGPGLHTLEVTRGVYGKDLPVPNEQRIMFTLY